MQGFELHVYGGAAFVVISLATIGLVHLAFEAVKVVFSLINRRGKGEV